MKRKVKHIKAVYSLKKTGVYMQKKSYIDNFTFHKAAAIIHGV